MLTFEKVLAVFSDYLSADDMYEVVLTSHGYTLMGWNSPRKEWHTADFMETPKKLMEALLETYADFLTNQITDSSRDATPAEQIEIESKCRKLRECCIAA